MLKYFRFVPVGADHVLRETRHSPNLVLCYPNVEDGEPTFAQNWANIWQAMGQRLASAGLLGESRNSPNADLILGQRRTQRTNI